MDIVNQKNLADSMLASLYPMDAFAICAGGAPREWDVGQEAKDIDIFYYCDPRVAMGMHERQLAALGIAIQERKEGADIPEHYKRNPDLECVYNCEMDGQEVQLMRMKRSTFQSVIPAFPISISKVWYKNGKIERDRLYEISRELKVLIKTSEAYPNDDKYIMKIREKFPDYRYFESYDELKEDYEYEQKYPRAVPIAPPVGQNLLPQQWILDEIERLKIKNLDNAVNPPIIQQWWGF